MEGEGGWFGLVPFLRRGPGPPAAREFERVGADQEPWVPLLTQLLPVGKKRQQKVALGDANGVVQCMAVKKGQTEAVFKTLPTRQPVSTVVLGASSAQADRIFSASGQTIRGHSKTGKEFFKFATNLAEDIRHLHIEGTEIWTTGRTTCNLLMNYKDCESYVSPSPISASIMVPGVSAEKDRNPVLGCEDRRLRVVKGSEVYFEASVDGPVSAVVDARAGSNVPVIAGQAEVIYGTETGTVGLLKLDSESVRRGWTVGKRGGGVTSIDASLDLSKDGVPDVIVGRDDGSLEIYALDQDHQPVLAFQRSLGDAVGTVGGGYVCSPSAEDIIVQTLSGKVVAFTSNGSTTLGGGAGVPPGVGSDAASKQAKQREKALKTEVEALKRKVADERQRYSKVSQGFVSSKMQSIQSKFYLDTEDSSYVLKLDGPAPIEAVTLQSTLPVDFLPSQISGVIMTTPEAPPALKTRAPSPFRNSATYRCQESTNRIEVRMRISEGSAGQVHAYVIPALPPKACSAISVRVRPLCLHFRASSAEGSEAGPMSELVISGEFSASEIHRWLGACLPEMTGPLEGGEDHVIFSNCRFGTALDVQYRNQRAVFRSLNVGTLGLLRENIANQATAQGTRVNISFNLNEGSITKVTQMVHPKIQEQLDIAAKLELIPGLQELKMQGEDVQAFLSQEYLEILDRADTLTRDESTGPKRLREFQELFKGMYVDWHRFNGHAVSRDGFSFLEASLNNPRTTGEDIVNIILDRV